MQRSASFILVATLSVTGGLLLFPRASSGVRFVPKDSEVLEKVVARPRRTEDLTVALASAQVLVEQARARGGDVRLLGRAQAVLTPWWTEPAPPPSVRLLRATIKQSLHDFEGALADLDVLVRDGSQVQAQLTRATVLMVLARHEEAEAACAALRGVVEPAVVTGCVAPLWAIRGRSAAAVDSLRRVLAVMEPAHPLRGWLTSELGEVLAWSGARDEAVTVLREAVRLDGSDAYSRRLLAMELTELGRAGEAVTLLRAGAGELNDAELLELALAAKACGREEATRWEAALEERVAANRRRGETTHRREEARFALRIEGDAARALALAEANFEVQREPADVRVLLESALAARDRGAASPALEWMARTGFGDARLQTLARAVESLP